MFKNRTWDRAARCAAAVTVVLVVGGALGGVSGAASSESALGKRSPATGAPVKIGMVTNGKSATLDTSIETPVAKATVKWLNAYRKGVGGHPIKLEICTDENDPGKATDCANQMISDKVAAVAIGQDGLVENIWKPLHAAGIPTFIYGAPNADVAGAADATFVMGNSTAALLTLPASVAKKTKAKKVSVVAIDVPAATSYFQGPGPAAFKKQGLKLQLIPVAAGTADMTPQMQRLTSGNRKGVVFVIGNDSFCIAAFNGLRTAGFEGAVTTIPQCITEATRTAVPADFLDGMTIAASAPIDTPKSPSMKQYNAVLDKFGGQDVDRSDISGIAMFQALGGMSVATSALKGAATPTSIIAATKAMPWSVMPGSGGTHIRCNGKADAKLHAVCSNAALAGKINAKGKVTKYTPIGDGRIPG